MRLGRGTYEIHLGLAVLLHRERERGLETRVLVAEQQERLVRALGGAVLRGGQDDLEGVFIAQCDGLREGDMVGEPTSRIGISTTLREAPQTGVGGRTCP